MVNAHLHTCLAGLDLALKWRANTARRDEAHPSAEVVRSCAIRQNCHDRHECLVRLMRLADQMATPS